MSVRVERADAAALPLEAESVDCIVTSPPYNCGMEYEGVEDERPWAEYAGDVARWAREMHRVTMPGGRVWVNVPQALPNREDPDQRRNLAALWFKALTDSGLKYRDTLVWHQAGADAATAWGSWLSPNVPNIRGRWEPILLFFKDTWARGRVGQNDITAEQFPPWTINVWNLPCESRNGHPAPFPKRLPRRCILLSTWPGDTVLDPFCGSGTTLKVAKDLGRNAIGFDLSEKYVEMSRARCAQEVLPV